MPDVHSSDTEIKGRNTKNFLAIRIISARGPASASGKWGRPARPVRCHRKGFVREPWGEGVAGTGRWTSTCSVTSAKVTCGAGGEPHSHRSPGIGAHAGRASSHGAAQGREGPHGPQQPLQEQRHVGWERTRGLLSASLPGTSPGQSASATEGAAPPLKGTGRLACKPTPPQRSCGPTRPLGGRIHQAGCFSDPPPSALSKAKAWQGPGRGSGGGGSP